MTMSSLGQLKNTHDRQGEVLGGLREAARRLAGGRGGPEEMTTIENALHFLGRAVPRHFADEEQSLFPRLRNHRPDLGKEIDRIVAEHAVHLALHDQLAAAVAGWREAPRPADARPLIDVVEALCSAHEAHVEAEKALFAEAAVAIGPSEDAAIEHEMAERRGK
jgi:hemerythrin-like domain-containing protein